MPLSDFPTTWTPIRLPGLLGWFQAKRNSVTIDGSPDVLTWRSSGPDATILTSTGIAAPDWLPNARGANNSAIGFDVAIGNAMTVGAGAILTAIEGTDIPLSIFCTVKPTGTGDQVLIGWEDTIGSSEAALHLLSSGVLRYRKVDTGAGAANVDGSVGIGLRWYRVGVIHTGTVASIYLDREIHATGASNVGAVDFDTFKIGSGPGAVDGFIGQFGDALVLNRAASFAEYHAYCDWSVRQYGYL